MKYDTIIFTLSNSEKIVFELKTTLDQVHCCYEALIVFVNQEKKVNIGGSTVNDSMSVFNTVLTEVLHNALPLDPSFTKDVGYVNNQYSRYLDRGKLKKDSNFNNTRDPKSGMWIGEKYRLWDYDFTAWMYNGTNEEIVFEITPIWPGFFGKTRERNKAISYAQWMAEYKPYLITTIPRDVAQQWLEQAEHILKTIEENIQRFAAEAKAAETTTKDLE